MEYVKIHPIKNEEIDTFVEDCNLFAVLMHLLMYYSLKI